MQYGGSDDSSGGVFAIRSYALHDAAEVGDSELLGEILAGPARDTGYTPEAALKRELSSELDIDELDNSESSPLHIALLKGHLEAAALLLAKGASVRRSCEGSPPLHLAVCSAAHAHRAEGALAAVKLLLDHGAQATQRDDNGRTALHWAASLGLTQIMTILLQYFEAQAAQEAARLQDATAMTAENALEHTALPTLHVLQDKQGSTALHLAASSGQPEACHLLLGSANGRAAASVTNKANQTALHLAAAYGEVVVAEKLLHTYQKAASMRDKFGRTPFHWATLRGQKEMAQLLQGETMRENGVKQAEPDLCSPPTLIVAPPACREHRTAPEPIVRGMDVPPENVNRLHVLTDPEDGILRTAAFAHLQWDEQDRLLPIADILKVHEWTYVRRIQAICSSLADDPTAIGQLDPDTAMSRQTWSAALAAAGACCHAIDCIMAGQARNAFCAIRPPGHHAGPLGTVTSVNDPHGSQGFCFFNNIAVAAAYAVNVYRHQGIRRIAMLDFDVHHGNGTQACVARVIPQVVQYSVGTPLCEGSMRFQTFHPWLDEHDADNILFASVQGYGKKPSGEGGFVYPGSGATCDTKKAPSTEQEQSLEQGPSDGLLDDGIGEIPPDDPDMEFATGGGEHPSACGPRIINVGIPGPGSEISLWRRAWRDKILPAVADFKPDLIIISAGFDAHKKDELNYHFIGVTERDYYWLTQQLVSLANTVCRGRLVSALEGGYRIQGGIVSAFSRSVAAHVQALSEVNYQEWSLDEARRERAIELHRRREMLAAKRANAVKAAERAAERAQQTALAAIQTAGSEAAAGAATPLTAGGAHTEAASVTRDPLPVGELAQNLDNGADRKRRRRAPVDYAALNLKIEEEAKRAKPNGEAAKGPLSSQVPQKPPVAATPEQPERVFGDQQAFDGA